MCVCMKAETVKTCSFRLHEPLLLLTGCKAADNSGQSKCMTPLRHQNAEATSASVFTVDRWWPRPACNHHTCQSHLPENRFNFKSCSMRVAATLPGGYHSLHLCSNYPSPKQILPKVPKTKPQTGISRNSSCGVWVMQVREGHCRSDNGREEAGQVEGLQTWGDGLHSSTDSPVHLVSYRACSCGDALGCLRAHALLLFLLLLSQHTPARSPYEVKGIMAIVKIRLLL